jgi:hypothetical protein
MYSLVPLSQDTLVPFVSHANIMLHQMRFRVGIYLYRRQDRVGDPVSYVAVLGIHMLIHEANRNGARCTRVHGLHLTVCIARLD